MNQSRRGAVVTALIGGITLFVLALTVFAVAVQARSVSREAERTVQLIEDLRIVSVSRAEMSIASRVAAVAPDRQELITAASENSVDALETVRDRFETDGSPRVKAAYAAYEDAVDDQSTLLMSGDADQEESVEAELATGTTFDELSTLLRQEQEEALDQLRIDNDLMNTIGTISTFMVAFVVPSAALYIFETLRRTPRRTRELDYRLTQLEGRSRAMAMATQRELVALRTHLFASDSEPSVAEQQVKRSLLRLDHMASINGAISAVRMEPMDVSAVAREVASLFGEQPIDVQIIGEVPMSNGDPIQTALILNELIRNAHHHGSDPVSVVVRESNGSVTVSVSDEGSGIPPVVESAVFLDHDYALRNNLASGQFGFGLFAARQAALSMDATLGYRRELGRTIVTLSLPAADEVRRNGGATAPIARAA